MKKTGKEIYNEICTLSAAIYARKRDPDRKRRAIPFRPSTIEELQKLREELLAKQYEVNP